MAKVRDGMIGKMGFCSLEHNNSLKVLNPKFLGLARKIETKSMICEKCGK
jgi:hypothetical protein